MFFHFKNPDDYLVLGKTGPFWFFPAHKIPQKDRGDHMHIVCTTGNLFRYDSASNQYILALFK